MARGDKRGGWFWWACRRRRRGRHRAYVRTRLPNNPVEVLETKSPMFIESYGYRTDTGGTGPTVAESEWGATTASRPRRQQSAQAVVHRRGPRWEQQPRHRQPRYRTGGPSGWQLQPHDGSRSPVSDNLRLSRRSPSSSASNRDLDLPWERFISSPNDAPSATRNPILWKRSRLSCYPNTKECRPTTSSQSCSGV
jgi:hypothetical protein